MNRGAKKPVSIWIVSGFLWLATCISLLVGFVLVLPGTGVDRMWQLNQPAHAVFQRMGNWSGVAFLVLAIVVGFIAAAFSRGDRWAWWAAIVLFAINGLGDVVGLIVQRDYVRSGFGMGIAGSFLLILFSHPLRDYFECRPRGNRELS